MDCGKSWRAFVVPTILRQLHEGQQGQAKHNGSLSGSFHISNGVKQGCVLAPILLSNSFSIMLREAKEDLLDGICIRFRTDGSVFNRPCPLARTKIFMELITELLLADDCSLLAHTEEALQHIVNCFSDAAKNFGLTINPRKTEVLYHPTPRTVLLKRTLPPPRTVLLKRTFLLRIVQSSSDQLRWHRPQRSGAFYLPE